MVVRNVCGPGLLVVLFSLLIVVQATAQGIPQGSASTDTGLGGVNTISGMVLSSTGQRVERRVSVRLQSMTKGDRLTTSDDYGNFVFRGVPPGDYNIVIEKEKDFEPFSQYVSVIQPRGMPPQIYNLSIRLILKGPADTRTGVLNAELAKVPPRAVTFYQKALEKSKAGKNADAVDQLQKAIAEYPQFALALTELGVQYQRLNQLDRAEQSLKSALEISPDSFAALVNYGIVLVRLNLYAEAETQLRLALKQNDQSAVAHYYLGRALAYLGRYDNAEVELNLALAFGGEEMKEAHRYLAGVYSARGKSKRAIAELETYLKLAPMTPDADQLRQMIAKLRSSTQSPKQ
jgi:tetratricopeptide (TPR) repeat protein